MEENTMKTVRKSLLKNAIVMLLVFVLLMPFISSAISLSASADTGMNCDEEHNNAVTTFVISPEGETVLEAEDGKHFWPADPNYAVGPYPGGVGSNGSGFVAGFYANPGAYIEYPINVETIGKYTVKVCYANGGSASPEFGIYIDGVQVNLHGYAPVGGWGDWGTYEFVLTVSAGEHTLRFVAEPGMVDAINVDYISFELESDMNYDETHNNAVQTFVIAQEGENVLEAEDGKHFWPFIPNWTVGPYPGGVGSNGTGFVAGFTGNPGSYVEYPVSVEKTGKYAVKVCYANGGSASPVFGIYIDGVQADVHGYAPVGGWGDWGTYELELTLTAGEHTIRFVAEPGMADAINLDYISFEYAADVTLLAGDFDNNGVLTISDVTCLLNYLAVMKTLDLSYDLDGDGNVTIADVTKLLNILSTM